MVAILLSRFRTSETIALQGFAQLNVATALHKVSGDART